MKKLFFVMALVLITGLTFGQTLQKGNVLGFHNGTFIPNPDVTLNQCIGFMKDKYLPEVEKNFPGVKCYILKGLRGEATDCISFVYVFPSDEIRNKFWKSEGTFTDLGNAAVEKLKPVSDEMGKYGKLIDKYTDWVVL
jgi:hypothetical protein